MLIGYSFYLSTQKIDKYDWKLMPYFTSQDKLELKGTILYQGNKKLALFENFPEGNCINYLDELSALSNIGYQYYFKN